MYNNMKIFGGTPKPPADKISVIKRSAINIMK